MVSILVLMDFALKLGRQRRLGRRIGVSILVLMDFALKHMPKEKEIFNQLVSILVLMDFALKPTSPSGNVKIRFRFQSLF